MIFSHQKHLTILLLTTFIAQEALQTSGLCYTKITFDGETCSLCYKSKPTTNGGCSPVLPESDPCLSYGLNYKREVSCTQCKVGFELVINNTLNTCRPVTPIFN